jgi:hypothetical protein
VSNTRSGVSNPPPNVQDDKAEADAECASLREARDESEKAREEAERLRDLAQEAAKYLPTPYPFDHPFATFFSLTPCMAGVVNESWTYYCKTVPHLILAVMLGSMGIGALL